ncbi:MAG: helix-turn-helix domain-containing protein [Fibrobacter sp.]|nr:helix-turn-helix domain-containing protein [Fibrobacter sp.]
MVEPIDEKKAEENLGAYIARIRASRGLTVEELARATKLSVSNVKSIEASDWKAFPVAAYARGYINSVCSKLNIDQKMAQECYSAECGESSYKKYEDVSKLGTVSPMTEQETKKKSKAVPIVLVLLVVLFLVLSHFLNLESLTEGPFLEKMPFSGEPAVVDSSEEQEMPEGAERVPADSIAKDSTVADTNKKATEKKDNSLSQAVIDEALKKSDLPASATIFISSDSKKQAPEEPKAENANAANKKKTNLILIGSGEALSWVGLKNHESDNTFLREANISREGVKMYYSTEDTLCVTIGDPKAIASMLLNGVETALPEMKYGRVTRFKVFGGKIVR